MIQTLEHWKPFFDESPRPDPMPSVILASWSRCEGTGVDRNPEHVQFRRISDSDLHARLLENEHWLSIARPHLEWLASTFRLMPHVVYVTDKQGIVLHSVGSDEIIQSYGLSPGYDWSEAAMGTNGAGTALVADQPVAVVGPQHWVNSFSDCTCTAAPIHGTDGLLLGAIDVSSSVADANPDRLLIVAHTAYAIEQELLQECEVNDEVAATLEALRTANRRKDKFIATLAHELRNPLAPIRNAVQLLRSKGPAEPELTYASDVIDRQVGLLARLLDDLLDVSRIAHSKLELRKQRVPLKPLLENAIEISRPLIEQEI